MKLEEVLREKRAEILAIVAKHSPGNFLTADGRILRQAQDRDGRRLKADELN